MSAPADPIDRALQHILHRAPQPSRLRFNVDHSRGAGVTRLSDDDLSRDLKICVILTDPDHTPPERITREARGRIYDYAHFIRKEIARRQELAR
ncbi:hypothetical protein ACFY0F_23810 [Streptomyces sp. NPDC001544]|uniref:hypothetical protein n=1 Tax=Streptomyces sp. NPDC001544 TaxID=3364584 RepID=UPI0036749DF4